MTNLISCQTIGKRLRNCRRLEQGAIVGNDTPMGRNSGRLRLGIAIMAMLSTSACVASYRNHGYIPPQDQLDEIVVGVDTKDSVAETIGSPTSAGLLDESGYYYVRTRMKNLGFRASETVGREVVAVTFNANGTVANIERFGLEDGRVITLERRVTESSVVDRTFLRQLLGSFGRLTPSDL
jgi:outer membrane protein assembly factor BamE (lipoprotein component of BamABCDE complex)